MTPLDQRETWLTRIGSLRQWSRGEERAPHKPLLILYCLGRLQRDGSSRIAYAHAESDLARLLQEFGPPRKTQASYPFRRLENDGLWHVSGVGPDVGESPARLRASGATGSLTADFEGALKADPGLVVLIAHALLDAAHIRWWAFDGPDTIDNALCLCSLHHKLLDRGVLGITVDNQVSVSQLFVGRGQAADELVLRLVGQSLIEPQPGNATPTAEHVLWHGAEVFRGPARVPA